MVEALAENTCGSFVSDTTLTIYILHYTRTEWPSKRSKTNVEAKPMTDVFVSAAATPITALSSGKRATEVEDQGRRPRSPD